MIPVFTRLATATRRIALAAAVVAAGLVPATAADDLKVALILPGPISDNDWNAGGYAGLMAAKDNLDIEVAYSENVADADAERVMRDYASRGYGLVIAHSFSYGAATLATAEDYPEVMFLAGTAQELAENVGTYDNPDYQGAYLTGMLAAGASESGKIGWVGGNPAPNMLANYHAWKAGAEAVDPEITVMLTWIGSWFDPPKTKEASIAQVEQGADVLSAQAVGVIDAAVEKDVLAIGAVSDQNFLGPDVVLTSVLWDLGPVYTDVAKSVMEGTWESRAWTYGIKEGSIKLADFHGLDSNVDPAVLAEVEETMAAIKAGDFVVPHDTSMVE
ncbi:BMP family protein [Devosia sp.]|uniref:BMP family protein n=1 Tax=Devosia sp. TaxID=1871048 RepID=UPI003A91BC80